MDLQDWRVLVVDDEFDSVQLVTKVLTYYRIDVRMARSGAEGLAILRSFEPVLIIIDLLMPGMDGFELLGQLRADPLTLHLPTIAITAYHSAVVDAHVHKAGFDGYCKKPITSTNLIAEVSQVMRRSSVS